jgi:NADH-ubiquinone oxidoreductase chain 3
MTSTTFFIIFIPILAILLLAINLILAPHNPYQEKDSAFECGFHSFLGQNRTQFSVSFFIFGLLFLLFDLEILLVYPYSVSSYTNDIYGLVVMMVFFVLLTLGFIFELGKNALTIDSRQTSSYSNNDTTTPVTCIDDRQTSSYSNNDTTTPVTRIDDIVILQSSMLPDLVDILNTIVNTLPGGEDLYEKAIKAATDLAAVPETIKEIAAGEEQKIQEAYEAVTNCNNTGSSPEDVKAGLDSAKALLDSGKDELKESVEVAKEIYEDRN